jgi:hypothetical protein
MESASANTVANQHLFEEVICSGSYISRDALLPLNIGGQVFAALREIFIGQIFNSLFAAMAALCF